MKTIVFIDLIIMQFLSKWENDE